jgi:hypothetical protein
MLEAAAPTATLAPMVQAAGAALEASGANSRSGVAAAAAGMTKGHGASPRVSWSGAALRALRSARAALKHMAALEPLLERFQLAEPFAWEMPLIPLLAELSTSGMVLDWTYLRRLREEVEEQKKALQRLAAKVIPGRGESWATFGGVAVRKASNNAEINLGSPKDVSEVLETWNLPALLRRKTKGVGKSDTKSETLQGYLEDLEALREAHRADPKKHEKPEWTEDALRFLKAVMEYRHLDRLPASLNGLTSYVVKCKTLPLPAGAVVPTYSPSLIDRIVPEVVHAKAEAGSSGAGGSGSGVAVMVGLAATGRVSVKPLQHVQKEATFRRPKYRSLQEELLQRRPQELLSVASRCMVTFASGGGTGNASQGPLEVRFGELCDIKALQSIADTPAFDDRGGAKSNSSPVPSVADYWRSKGFSYSHEAAQRVVCVSIKLDGGSSLCTYPADQVFRLNGSVVFAEDEAAPSQNENASENLSASPAPSSMEVSYCAAARTPEDSSDRPRTPWCADVRLSPRDVLRSSPGRLLLSADFCQVEVRILAHYSEDRFLLSAFAEPPAGADAGEDFFRRLARHWRGTAPGVPITVAERSAAKEMCYGIIYGAGEGRVAQMLGISVSEARNHLREFKSRFREASDFKERVQRDCSRTDMTVRTILGRQRLVDRVFTQAVNTVIQGSAADLMKVSMLKIHRRLLKELGVPAHSFTKCGQLPLAPWALLERRCRLVNMLHDEVM